MDSKQKKQAGDELLDAVIKNAFTEVFRKEMEELEAEAPKYSDRRPSKEHLEIERRAYKKAQRKPINFWSLSRRIVASVLIVLGLGGIVLFCVPEVKASVLDTVIEFFENHIGFDFSTSKTEIQLGEHTIYYLPKGYTLADSIESPGYNQYIFTNEDNIIILTDMMNDITKIGMDDENCTIQSINIHEYIAYALIPNNPEEDNMIIWGNEKQSFILEGSVPLDELTQIAKSIK